MMQTLHALEDRLQATGWHYIGYLGIPLWIGAILYEWPVNAAVWNFNAGLALGTLVSLIATVSVLDRSRREIRALRERAEAAEAQRGLNSGISLVDYGPPMERMDR